MDQKRIAGILKVFCVFVALVGGIFFFWYVPVLIEQISFMEDLPQLRWPGTVGMWMIAVMCYLALFDFVGICRRIGKDNSFCKENARSMARIGIYALVVMVLILGGTLALFAMQLMDIAMFFIIFFVEFVALGIAVICYALSKLIENAAVLKEESDLTI